MKTQHDDDEENLMADALSKVDKKQKGAAVLVVSVVLLIAVTLVVLFAARIGLQDQRISGNQYRHKQATAKADAGLEYAASYLRANPDLHDGAASDGWAACAGSTSLFPCDQPDAQSVFATVVTGTSITSSINNVNAWDESQSFLVKTSDSTLAIGTGTSDDGTGASVAMIEYAKASLLTPGQIPPLMTPNADLSGSFTIVPDPNGGGPGVPISAWVKEIDSSKNTGSWQTCHHGDFQDAGVCIDTLDDSDSWSTCGCVENISDKNDISDDIVVADLTGQPFPESPFAYAFGADDENTDGDGILDQGLLDELIAEKKDRASAMGIVLPNCTGIDGLDLNSLIEPFVWIEGACDIPAGSLIGDRTTPLILVVEGDLKVSSNAEIWGIVFGFGEFTMNGGAVVHGSAISENSSKLTNGSYAQVYDESVFQTLANDVLTVDISKIQYSWRDF